MSRMNKDRGDSRDRFQTGAPVKPTQTSAKGIEFVDYKNAEALRRMMTPNGKIYGRKRLGTNARQQRMVARAIKRARFIGLLPFTSATL
jgi:small subunit ribosomal protein S18